VDPKLRLLLVAADNPDFERNTASVSRRRRFSVEIDRRGMFAHLWRFDVYLCAERESAWAVEREPGGIDVQLWRLHLMLSRVPM
jgi:hypothetical protein